MPFTESRSHSILEAAFAREGMPNGFSPSQGQRPPVEWTAAGVALLLTLIRNPRMPQDMQEAASKVLFNLAAALEPRLFEGDPNNDRDCPLFRAVDALTRDAEDVRTGRLRKE